MVWLRLSPGERFPPASQIQDLAIRCIQKNIKKNRGVKDWPWWKLFTTVRPLIEVQLSEEQIRGKDVSAPAGVAARGPDPLPLGASGGSERVWSRFGSEGSGCAGNELRSGDTRPNISEMNETFSS